MDVPKFTNALIHETSPYLLQHAHNPVEWYPWGAEALAKAKKEDKPILLSIGYSACHWCHVMAHESFEDEAIAALMNRYFVNIKVDREERPDLDAIYMAAVQLMTGRGGWPMTVFLTPEQQPFFGGTYFPREDRYGMPGFGRLLQAIAQSYREKKQALYQDAAAVTGELQRLDRGAAASEKLHASILEQAAASMASGYDARYGGFGDAPKFPPAMALSFLMRSCLRRGGDTAYLDIINTTLIHMACGGIYDQLGGGFHRYSVDAHWLVPHFEKMLYDNALLSRLYLDGFLLTGNTFYQNICRETLDYVLREMTSPEGAFYSSQDADSEGKEGAFFVWTEASIRALLGNDDAGQFCRYYGVTPGGNFEGANILHIPLPADQGNGREAVMNARMQPVLLQSRAKLWEARERRPRPGRDEKALASWNALMLRSFAEAARVLRSARYLHAAIRNAEFLLSRMRIEGRLLHSYKDGQARLNAYLEDYACLIDALLALYEATFDWRWIREAEALAGSMIDKFWDPQSRELFFTSGDHESLIHRPRDFMDNATPSGNSVAAGALLRLDRLVGGDRWAPYATAILQNGAPWMQRHSAAVAHLLCALDFLLGPVRAIAIIGDPDSEPAQDMLEEVYRRYLPNKVVACGPEGSLGLLEGKPPVHGLVTAYVCDNYGCRQPATSVAALREALS